MPLMFGLAHPDSPWHGGSAVGQGRLKPAKFVLCGGNLDATVAHLWRELWCVAGRLGAVRRGRQSDGHERHGDHHPASTHSRPDGSAGNITIEQGATLRVSTPGAALTLNSSNNITHAGLLEQLANGDAIGVHLVGGFAGDFTAQGAAGAI